eukprot:COSAG01_NODE_14322_length_1468_cov_21.799123_1_plen_98_part_10
MHAILRSVVGHPKDPAAIPLLTLAEHQNLLSTASYLASYTPTPWLAAAFTLAAPVPCAAALRTAAAAAPRARPVRPRGWAGLRRRPGLGRLGCAPGAA